MESNNADDAIRRIKNQGFFPASVSAPLNQTPQKLLDALANQKQIESTRDRLQTSASVWRAVRNSALLLSALMIPAAVAFTGVATILAATGFVAISAASAYQHNRQNHLAKQFGKWLQEIKTEVSRQRFLTKGTIALENGKGFGDSNRFNDGREDEGGSGVLAPNRPRGPRPSPLAAYAVPDRSRHIG